MLSRIGFCSTLSLLFFFAISVHSVKASTLFVENGFYSLGPTDVVDDVVIRNGGILLMDGAAVAGDIKIEVGGVLAASRSTILGDIKGNRAFLVDLVLCDIGGDVELKRTQGSEPLFGLLFPSIDLLNCIVDGDVKISDSNVNFITITDNVIGEKLQLKRNLSVLPIKVENNVVGNRKKNDCD